MASTATHSNGGEQQPPKAAADTEQTRYAFKVSLAFMCDVQATRLLQLNPFSLFEKSGYLTHHEIYSCSKDYYFDSYAHFGIHEVRE